MATNSRSTISKRLRQDSDDLEVICQKCDNLTKERVSCSGCQLNFCLRCASISATLWTCISKGELDNFIWSCRSCRATFPSLDNISKVLGDIQTTTNSRMDKFEARLGKIEERTQNEIKSSVSDMKSEIIESLQTNIESLVDSRTKELEDRKRRESNLVLFNVPEHRYPRAEENKMQDMEYIQRLSSCLGLESPQIITCFRLGKKSLTSNRPLKLVLEMKSQEKFLLDNAKSVPEKAPGNLRQVIIVKDMTIKQREERRERRRNRGRNVEPADRQNIQPDHNRSNTMEIDPAQQQLPSPIPGNENIQNQSLSQLNIHSSTSVFDDTTLVEHIGPNSESAETDAGDDTVIGGVNEDASSISSQGSNF